MRKLFTLLFILGSILVNAQSTTVVISQVAGGGGGATGTYLFDYIELHNISAVSQDITGFKLMYGSALGQFASTASNSYTFPATTVIPAGGYLFIQTGTTGTVGAAFPVSPDLITPNLSMAGTSGKVALVNSSFAINTCGATATPCNGTQLTSFIDWVAFGAAGNGTAGNGEGGTSVNNGVALTATQGCLRKLNGCQDNNNNNLDFTVTTNPIPRNSTSLVVTCGGPVATISASPNISNITTIVGIASTSQSFNLSASNLTPAAGNLSIAPSAGLEISFDNSNFFSTAQNFAYTGSTVASTAIYVRISATAAQGALTSASVTSSGGGAASNAVITVTGGVSQNFYSQPTGNLSTLATWGIVNNGTGTAPTSFTNPYQIFNVVNRASASPGAHWEVTGTGSKLIIGDGTNSTTVTTSITDTIKNTSIVDILNNGILEIGSRVAPTFGNLATGSTVNYNFNGTATTDTVKVNAAAYHHLILKDGLKYLKSGTTTVNGNLVYDGTINSNGAASPFSTVSLKGNLTMINAAAIEDSTTGAANRFTLSMAGTGAQLISTQGNELNIFRLIRDTTVLNNVDITLAANSKITLGNNTSGGLSLLQKVAGTPTLTRLILNSNAQLAIVKNGIVFTDATKAGKISSIDGKIIINKSITSTSNPGILVFEPGSTLNDLTVNITTPAKDSVIINGTVEITGNANLTKGIIVLTTGSTLIINAAATITGGSASSYIDGKVRKVNPSVSTFLFPTGQAKQYAPVEMSGLTASSDFTVQYFKQAYSNLVINPSTLAATPTYSVSTKEYWNIDRVGTGNPNIKFYYNAGSLVDGSQAKIAHFNGVDWDDIGRDSYGSDVNGNFIAQNTISTFSPFTFGGAAGVLPIKLESFNGALQNNTSTLQWKTSCEAAGDKFELQYSLDGRNFETIYNTAAMGNCNGNRYAYLHKNATAASNYYRLISISVDGRSAISNIINLRNGKTNFELAVLPNNTSTQMAFSITAAVNGNAAIKISTTNGQVLYKQNILYPAGTKINYFNTEKLSKGLYLITVVNNNGNVITQKFIK
jgi:hypothetical protein